MLERGLVLAYVALGGNPWNGESINGGLDIIDVSDPSHPIPRGSYYTSAPPYRAVVANAVAYLAAYRQLEIIDISSPANPRRRGIIVLPSGFSDMQIVNNLVYIEGWQWGVEILRIHPERFPLPAFVVYLPLVHR